ncbi:MAG TPA: alpha/beta hydrolase family protein [Clostridia bacterium]|nr:alpha/beta hydrolase family protein [Clostridia bacterium]
MYQASRENIDFIVKEGRPRELYFDSPLPSGDGKVDRVKALLFEAEKPKGAVIFLHGLGNRNFKPLRYYPENFQHNGYTVVMPILPYHFERTPEGKKSGVAFLQGTDEEIMSHFEQAVTDVLVCLDYLQKSGYSRMNIMGFSFGGMISAIVMGLDRRIEKGIFVVTGGNFEYITWQSVATRVLRVSYEENEECNQEKCHQLHLAFDSFARTFSSPLDLEKMPVCFRYDPSLFAGLIKADKVLMFNALFDPFIPRKSADDLWVRLGKPKRYFLFSGHLTAHLLGKRFILDKSLAFLEGKEEEIFS